MNAEFRFEYEFIEKYMTFYVKSVNPEIDIAKGPMPDHMHETNFPENITYFRENIVLHYSMMHFAYSHFLMDHFYAMWRTLNYFHLYDFNNSRPLFVGYKTRDKKVDYRTVYDGFGAKNSWDHNELSVDIGLEFVDQIMPFLWSQHPLFLSFENDFVDDELLKNEMFHRVFDDISGSDLVCFDSVVIEMGYWFRHWDLSQFIQLFTDKVHRADDGKQRKQKILILAQNEDDGRRQFTSDPPLESIQDFLADLFGVEVVVAHSKGIYSEMDGVVQHQRHSYIDSIDVLDLPRGRLCLHGSLDSQNNHCRNVAHAALSRPNDSERTD